MAQKKRVILKVPVADVQSPAYMVRSESVDSPAVQVLAQRIQEVGLIQPIVVRPVDDRYVLIAGWRRLHAHKFAQIPLIDADVRDVDEETAMKMRCQENEDREDVNPADGCRFVREIMILSGKNQKQVAQMLGKSEGYISQRLRVLDGYPCVYNALLKEEITFNQARELVQYPDEVYAKQYMHIAREQGASADTLRRWCADLQQDPVVQAQVGEPEQEHEVVVPTEMQFMCECCRNAQYMRDVVILKLCYTCANGIIAAATADSRAKSGE